MSASLVDGLDGVTTEACDPSNDLGVDRVGHYGTCKNGDH